MRVLALAVILATVNAGMARAEACDLTRIWHRAEALIERVIGRPPSNAEVIAPPPGIDSRMALTPPAGDRLLVIPPSDQSGR